jgi:phosphate transport system substrate-binding protein
MVLEGDVTYMSQFRRAIGFAIAAVVLLAGVAPIAAYGAQTPAPVTVDGSALVAPVVEAARATYITRNPETNITVNVSGTNDGLAALCAGELDIAMAYGPISESQAAACQSGGVEFVEIMLGYDALVPIVNNQSPATCLTVDQFNALFGPSGADVANWQALDPALADTAIGTIFAPTAVSDYPTRFRFAQLSAVGALRSDIVALDTSANVAENVNSAADAVGLMTLYEFSQVNPEQQQVRALQINVDGVCIDASVPDLDEGRYPISESLLLYVNASSLDRPEVSGFLDYLVSNEGRRSVRTGGYTNASTVVYDRDQSYLAERRTGRTFSLIRAVEVPADVTGAIRTAGSSIAYASLRAVNDTFAPRYANVTLTSTAFGDEAGYRDLCAGEVDAVGAARGMTDAEAEACQSAGIQTLEVSIGNKALVVVVNEAADYAACLTGDQVRDIFSQAARPATWSEVDASFPDTTLLALTPRAGNSDMDFLLARVAGDQIAPPRRTDATENDDALYRAAAVGNVEGGVTFMTFEEFSASEANVRAVGIDAGNGCVEPSAATFADGSYALSAPLSLVFNTASFERPEVRAYVWYLLGDDALAVLGNQNLTGLDEAQFQAVREIVLQRFAELDAAAPTPAPTSEAGAEATAEATAESAGEVTPEPSAEATDEATDGPAAEPTTEPTPGE